VSHANELVQVVSQLASVRELSAVTQIIRTAARRLTSADGVTFVLRDGAHCFYADEDAIAPLWKGRRFPLHDCVSGWVMRRRQPTVIPDIYDDPRVPQEAYRSTFVRSMAMVPVNQDEPVGAIGAYWATLYTVSPTELHTLTTLAESASLALANVKLYEELRTALARERAARQVAEEEAAARERFLAVVSHELRQPLQAALGALELMSRRASREKGIHARELLERQIHQMARVVDDLLDSSKIVRGEVEIRREVVDVRQLVRDAIEVSFTPANDGRVNSTLPETPVWVSADGSRLRQVFQNLLSNAEKFSPSDTPIALTVGGEQGYAVIAVKDQGIGMDAASVPRMFELFARADDRVAGYGIGLAVVRRLVELHGGTVHAHSQGLGTGSEFVVRLPLATTSG